MTSPSKHPRAALRALGFRPRLETLEDRTVLANEIVLENQLPGNPSSEWQVVGGGDPSLQGYATDISVDQGQTVRFKVQSLASSYRVDIYRMGYYGGLGARKVATVLPSAPQPQLQPIPIYDPATGMVDAGNWLESASWNVPANATSGIYFARLTRTDGFSGASHIPFIVRDDDGASDLLFQTSDTTWQAYNEWGGASLYQAHGRVLPNNRATKVSYNRPWGNKTPGNYYGTENWLFYSEYPMVLWLESNGYDVSYTTGVDSARRGSEIREHRAFLSVGHDEYWSGEQYDNVMDARFHGVHMGFFSGNEIFWKTRWENSIDASNTPYRTLVCYKETHANAKVDPSPSWTGTWADPRFSPPSDGGRPQNAMTGQYFMINGTFNDRVWVPEEEGKLRFWRNTDLATLQPGQQAGLSYGTLGFEADVDVNNGFRPAGSFRVSQGTYTVPLLLQDWGSTYAPGTATHSMTMFKAPCCELCSAALVFGAGTIQWSWGLWGEHDGFNTTPDPRVRQATVNLLADMGAQPETLQPGLVAATASTDTTAPTVTVTGSSGGPTAQVGGAVTVRGTAADVGGRVGGVEVTFNGGASWYRADGRADWSFVWTPAAPGDYTLYARAVDDSANVGSPVLAAQLTVLADNARAPAFSGITTTNVTPTSVTVNWVTDEPATSRVDYGTSTNNLNQNVSTSGLVTQHSMTLTNLTPNTSYVFRVTSRDEFNLTATSAGTSFFVTPAYHVTAAQDFHTGTVPATLAVAGEADGELILTPEVDAQFTGPSLDSGWSAALLTAGGTMSLTDGTAVLDGTRVATAAVYGPAPGRSVEFVANFNGPVQYGGFIQDTNTVPWAVFVTMNDGELRARSNPGSGVVETVLPSQYKGSLRKFRIDLTTTAVDYWIDDVLVATHNLVINGITRPFFADQNVDARPFVVSSARLANYAAAGTYVSPVYDAGQTVRMGPLSWTADVPAGTTLVMKMRTGNTPTPDATWTAFTTVSASGSDLGTQGRYAQFSADLAASAAGRTPTLKEVKLGYAAGSGTVDFPGTGGIGSEVVPTVDLPVRLTGTLSQVVTVNYTVIGGTATPGADYALAAGTLVFLPGETVKTIPMSVVNDILIEGDETVVIRLSAPSYATLGTNTTFTYTITDDDPNTQGFVIDDGEPGFSVTPGWIRFTGAGFRQDMYYLETSATGTEEATWTFNVSPGQYRVSATWLANANRSSNVPYRILDGGSQVSSVLINQRLAPSDFLDGGSGWKDLDIVSITGDTLVVKMRSNANPVYAIADAMRIEWRGELPTGPQVTVRDGASAIVNGGSVDLGTVVVGSPVTKTFTIDNVGTEPLVLQEPISLPAGYSLVSSFGATTLAPGESTTFAVRLDAAAGGTYTGRISFGTNDVADNPFRFTVTGVVSNVSIKDNGDPGFTATSGWIAYVGGGAQNDLHYVDSGTGGEVATWTFGVSPGQYRVSATWLANANRASNAPYTVLDGTTQVTQVAVNQRQAPDDFNDAGSAWEDLGVVQITGNTLVVRLTNNANPSYLIADAVRIERIGDLVVGPQVQVRNGGTPIANTGAVSLGTTMLHAAVTRTFTVQNVGTQDLVLQPTITVPAGYTLVNGFGATTLAPNASTTFTVRFNAATVGTTGGNISFTSNDPDDGTFTFAISGLVVTVALSDDGDAGYSQSGDWSSYTGLGFGNDTRAVASATGGSTATWTFTVSPGRYRVSTTWVAGADRAPNVPATILDGTTAVSQQRFDQRVAPGDLTADGANWKDLDVVSIGGTTLVVRLTNDAQPTQVLADAVRIERVGDLLAGPQVEVRDAGVTVANGGTVDYGNTIVGGPVTKTFTVKNVGTQPLTLDTPITVPAGYTLVSSFGSTTLAPNAQTTFVVRLDAASDGTFTGGLSFTSNDPDDGTFSVTLTGQVANVTVLDDGSPGYTTAGSWGTTTGAGHAGDYQSIASGTGSATATWAFSVSPGRYRVSATWVAAANRASNAPFTVLDGATAIGTYRLNQQAAPNDFNDGGSPWEDLAVVSITGSTLSVRLTNDALASLVVADAVRIERLGGLGQAPDVRVRDGGTELSNGGTVAFGQTFVGAPVTKTFTVQNVGTEALLLQEPISLPSGYALVSSFSTTTLASGATTTFVVRLTAAAIGTYNGQLSFGNSDPDDNPFRLTLTGSALTAVILDNGDPNFSATGSWQNYVGAGHANDMHYADSGTGGSVAAWTFTVTPGQYRVSGTWLANTNRASNVPYTILDGSTVVASVAVNQRVAPGDFTASGSAWEDIETVSVNGTSLTVRLTNNANGSYVIADAVRIERLGDALQGPQVQVKDGEVVVGNPGSVDVGTTLTGAPLTRTFTVRNLGTENLVLQEPITVPAGYTLAASFGSTTVAPGGSTTFAVRLDAAAVGTYAGEVSFGTNDAGDNPFRFSISGQARDVVILDDGAAGYAAGSGWTSYSGQGHAGDFSYMNSGPGVGVTAVTWTFAVSPGQYRVATTWLANANRSADAPYTILDGTTAVALARVNQREAPGEFSDAGSAWRTLDTVVVTGTTLTVRLTNEATAAYVIADAVRVERVTEPISGPQVQVRDGGALVAKNGTIDLGTLIRGTSVTKTFTVKNVGTEPLVLEEPITVPAGYTLVSSFGSTTLAPNATTTFEVRLTGATTGTFSGDVSFGTNDVGDNPFRFTLTAQVSNVAVIDDGEAGFTATSGWEAWTGAGFGNDFRYKAGGSGGQVAAWTFNVAAGQYRVSATWLANGNRASNAPYAVLDGATQLVATPLNQQNAPNDFTASGAAWEDIAVVTVTGTTLVVELRDNVSGVQYVIADAIRIERIG